MSEDTFIDGDWMGSGFSQGNSIPPGFSVLVDNEGNHLVDNESNELIAQD